MILEKATNQYDWIDQEAEQSARYFLICFERDGMNVVDVIGTLLQCCVEHNELFAHVKILRYCRTYIHALPEHYMEIVADNSTYDHYCRRLVEHLISLHAGQTE